MGSFQFTSVRYCAPVAKERGGGVEGERVREGIVKLARPISARPGHDSRTSVSRGELRRNQ